MLNCPVGIHLGEEPMSADQAPELALVVHTNDPRVRADLEALFPAEDVSVADNFVGGSEIGVFFGFAKEVLAKILDFVGKNRERITSAKLTIGRETISLEGYSADDVERLLDSSGFQKAMESVRQGQG